MFSAACVALFMGYPRDVVIALSHPKTGIAGEQTFLPSVAELRASLDRRVETEAGKERRERERERVQRILENPLVVATPEERERAIKRYLDEIRPGLVAGGAEPLAPPETPQEAFERMSAAAGVDPAAIPNARP